MIQQRNSVIGCRSYTILHPSVVSVSQDLVLVEFCGVEVQDGERGELEVTNDIDPIKEIEDLKMSLINKLVS